MTTVRTPNEEIVADAVTDVLVNRRRGRFALAITDTELILRQDGEVERIGYGSIDGVDASITDTKPSAPRNFPSTIWPEVMGDESKSSSDLLARSSANNLMDNAGLSISSTTDVFAKKGWTSQSFRLICSATYGL